MAPFLSTISFIDVKPISVTSVTDWSILFALIGVVAFFFGKIVSEIKPDKDEKYSNYTGGLVFLIVYVAFPAAILLFVLGKYPYFLSLWPAVLCQMILSCVNLWYMKISEMEKLDLLDRAEAKVIEQTKAIQGEYSLPPSAFEDSFLKTVLRTVFRLKLHDYVLWVIVAVHMWFTISIVAREPALIISLISCVTLFFVVISTAILTSWYKTRPYPLVVVHMDNETVITGKLRKIESDYVTVFSDDKIIHVSQSKINRIEKSIWKDPKKALKKSLLPKKK